jgi:hypothetical protein
MALHRDVYWVGRQWTVTGYGVQACNQKQRSNFDIEASRLWEDAQIEKLRAEAWLNTEDFDKALAIARQRFAKPPRKPAPHEHSLRDLNEAPDKQFSAESSEPAAQKFEMHVQAWPAKFVRPWRIRVRR